MYDQKSVRSVQSQISLGFNFVRHDTSHRSPHEETNQSESSLVCPTEGLTVTLLMFTEGDLSHANSPQQWRPLAIILPSENTTAGSIFGRLVPCGSGIFQGSMTARGRYCWVV